MAINFNVGLIVADEIQQEIEMQLFQLERRSLRDRSNPFDVPDNFFKKMYRLPKHLARNLIDEISVFLMEPVRNTSVPNHIKILCALHFFGHGSYQKSVGQDFLLAMSQTTVSRCVAAVSEILSTQFARRYIKFPQTAEERRRIKRQFMEKYNFPGVIGCIDCTHVAIVAPPLEHEEHPGFAYLNRKGFHSVNVQLISDSELKILNCNARYPGSTHDSAIWNMSNISRHLQGMNERGTWLLGDSGYPLQPWLLTPIEGAAVGTPEGRYTSAHISVRNTIERCNGVLKARFLCLLKHRVLHYTPPQAAKIIHSCCVLHNILIENNVELEEELEDDNNNAIANNNVQGNQHNNGNILAAGRRVRMQLIQNNFV